MPAEKSASDDRFIIVTGPGRSGTSAVSRVLHESGVAMGEQFDPPSAHNQRGFFEELPVCDLNQRIMAGCNMQGLTLWPSRSDVLTAAAAYRDEIETLVSSSSAHGWKDPRFCITLEAWLPHFSTPPKVVVCLRSPEAFIHSVVSIFGLSPLDELERWWANHLRRILSLIQDFRLEATCVVYEDLITKPNETIAELSSFVGKPLDANYVEPDLRQFSQAVPPRHAALFAEVRSLRTR